MKFHLDGFEVDSAEDKRFEWTRENETVLYDKKTQQAIQDMQWIHVKPRRYAEPVDESTLTAARAFLDALQIKRDELARAHQSRMMRESMESPSLAETSAEHLREDHQRHADRHVDDDD